ncbi:MAG: amidohydrolase family protein [Deltaproteobacteria bacterium]|nr:amidohydrolase family protein [Deltaproteobacteria bacterium]
MNDDSHSSTRNQETVSPPPRVHRAKWVMMTPDRIIENGAVTVVGNTISRVEPWGNGSASSSRRVTDHGTGLLMAGAINAHTHLDLSALKGRVHGSGTFLSWVRSLLQERGRMDPEAAESEALSAARNLCSRGTACVADIGAGPAGIQRLRQANLCGWFLWEVLGGSPLPRASLSKPLLNAASCEPGLSLAGHAPHTTPSETLVSAKQRTKEKGLLFSIHLAESEEEAAFIRTGKGEWADFLSERGITLVLPRTQRDTPVAYANELGLLDERTLAVHLRLAVWEDLRRLAEARCNVCICPRSNMRMYGTMPPVEDMLRAGIRPALGTDSLASVDDLDVWKEAAFLARQLPNLSPRDIMAMATSNGARALGLHSHFGELIPGRRAFMAFLSLDGYTAEDVLERAVYGEERKGVKSALGSCSDTL